MNTDTPVGFVYLLSAKGSGLHKIGHATNIEKRITQLQTGSSGELTLMKSWPGTREDEKSLHRALDAYRCNGEWFRFPKIVLHELLLMDEINVKSIRLPDCTNPFQVSPISNIIAAIGEIISIAEDPVVIELADRFRAHLDDAFWRPESEVDPDPIDSMIAEFEALRLDKRTQKRVVRMRDSFKCFLHWRSVEERMQAKTGHVSFRAWMRQIVGEMAVGEGEGK